MNTPLRIVIALLALTAPAVPCSAFAQAGGAPAASGAVSTASPLVAQPGGVTTPPAPPSYGATVVPGAVPAVATPDTGNPPTVASPAAVASGAPAVTEELPEMPWVLLAFTIVVVALVTAYIVNARTEKRPPP
jgi:hypothetical protein